MATSKISGMLSEAKILCFFKYYCFGNDKSHISVIFTIFTISQDKNRMERLEDKRNIIKEERKGGGNKGTYERKTGRMKERRWEKGTNYERKEGKKE